MCAGLLTSCERPAPGPGGDILRCDMETTPLATVQGKGYTSTMTGSNAAVHGIVTRVEHGSGLYLEGPNSNASLESSNAIFVQDAALSQLASPGQMMRVSGLVSELGESEDTLTALTKISGYRLCGENHDLPDTHMQLPLDSRQREALEGMRVSFVQDLTVTDVHDFHRGEVSLSTDGVLRVPTEDHPPGPVAANAAKKNRERLLLATVDGVERELLTSGSVVTNTVGVMGNNRLGQIFLPEQALGGRLPQAPDLKAMDAGNIRLASFNLLNFFNGDGLGGGFPNERGASSSDEFQAQANRIRSAIDIMQPHLLAVQELENDGFGPRSAARSLLDLLNESGHGNWSVVENDAGRIGNDIITVGLFYRSDILDAAGPASTLDGAPFEHLSRQPLAQLFRDRSTGRRFLVAVNHLKSKGRCPKTGDNADQGDGQGCWTPARVAAARAVSDWVNRLARETGTERALILGDMNAWRNEEPIKTFRDKGFNDLVEQIQGLPQYSYIYRGEAGTLDYAFASDALLPLVAHTEIWHINSVWPQKMELPEPWLRASDHDPVVVDLDLSQSIASD